MSSLSDKAKVVQLEEKILQGDIGAIETFIEANKPFEFTSRALGIASRCANPEIVELLIKYKMKFSYSRSGFIVKKYGLRHKQKSGIHYALFELMPIVDNIWHKHLFGDMDKRFTSDNKKIVYGDFYKGDINLSSYPKELTLAPVDIRIKNIKILFKNKLLKQSSLDVMLYYSILENEPEITYALEEMGAKLSCSWMFANKHKRNDLSDYNRFMQELCFKNDDVLFQVLTNLARALKTVDETLYVYSRVKDFFAKKPIAVYEALLLCTESRQNKVTSNKYKNDVWEYEQITDNTVKLITYKGTDSIVNIPLQIENLKVASIGVKCFCINNKKTQKDIQSIVIPDGVVNIDRQAFCDCENLTSITIPESIKTIGADAFKGCDKLEMVYTTSNDVLEILWPILGKKQKNRVLLNLIKSSQKKLFILEKVKYNKKNLVKHAIENNDVSLLDNIFSYLDIVSIQDLEEYIKQAIGCAEITSFLLEYKKSKYSAKQQEMYEIEKTDKELGIYEKAPSYWRKIYVYKKSTQGIEITSYKGDETEVFIPQKIGEENVIQIAKWSFSPKVKKLTANVKQIREKISIVDVPLGVRKIGFSAFEECKSLEKIVIPDSVKNIGSAAFMGCENLNEITLPCKLKQINKYTFCGCKKMTNITLPDGVKTIDDFSFSKCSSLEMIIIPDSMTSVGAAAFSECTKLKDIVFPNQISCIEAGVFYECENLNHFCVPTKASVIKVNAFRGCKSLEKVIIPSQVTEIDSLAFKDCPNLTIHAPAGSYAEQYAKENNIPFVAE